MHVPTRPGSEPQEEVLLVVLQSTGGARTNGTKVNGSFFKVTPDNFSSLSVSWCQYRRRCCRQPDRFCFPQSQITTAQFSRLSEIDQQLTWAPRTSENVDVTFLRISDVQSRLNSYGHDEAETHRYVTEVIREHAQKTFGGVCVAVF